MVLYAVFADVFILMCGSMQNFG